MNDLKFSGEICERCETFDCLTRCQYLKLDLQAAREEGQRLLREEKGKGHQISTGSSHEID